jgi:long-chain fatty acid transport protein
MRIGSLRRLALAVSSASFVLGIAGAASANGFEIPENGTEVMGRAGAWTAKADSPLALQHNPAGLAGQRGGLLVNSNFTFQSMCFQRAGNYAPTGGSRPDTIFKTTGDYGGDAYPEVCKKNGLANVNVVPQIIYAAPINERITIAAGLVSPSGTGKAEWSDTVTTANGNLAPAPNRYMLLSAETLIIFPTVSVGAAITPQFRVGASLQWGLAFLKFSNMSMATYPDASEWANQDLRADLKANSYFIPAVIAGAMFDASDDVTLAGMFRWSKDVTVNGGDVTITGPAYGNGTAVPCSNKATPCPTIGTVGKVNVPQPIDARLGFRFHPKRKDAPTTGKWERRDSLASELFDVEVDLTYSHNKSFETLGLEFPPNQLVALGSSGNAGKIPTDASVPHHWKDTVGVRVGFDFNAIPNKLALRAGGFFQTSAVEPAYANIDFLPSSMVGGFVGGTLRLSKLVDLSAGFGHIFVKSVDTNGTGQVKGLVAQDPVSCPAPTAADPKATTNVSYHSCAAVNDGKYTSAYNMFSLGATFHM